MNELCTNCKKEIEDPDHGFNGIGLCRECSKLAWQRFEKEQEKGLIPPVTNLSRFHGVINNMTKMVKKHVKVLHRIMLWVTAFLLLYVGFDFNLIVSILSPFVFLNMIVEINHIIRNDY